MRKALWSVPQPETNALKQLLGEVIPERSTSRAATIGASGTLHAPGSERRPNGVNYLHAAADGRIEKPSAKNAWWIGQAAAAVTKERWCNPALVLFACGHFTEFAIVLLGADEKQLLRDRKRQLVDHLPKVLETNPPWPAREELIRKHLAEGHDDVAARRAADWELEMLPSSRIDRAAWSLSGSENESLRAAWNAGQGRPVDLTNPAIAACHLASSGRVENDGPGTNVPYVTRMLIAKAAIEKFLAT